MSQPAGTPTSNPKASPEKQALLHAFDTVLKSQAEEREARRAEADAEARRNRSPSKLLMVLCATIIVFVSVYLYVERPEWVFAAPPAAESTAVKEASLRITVANAAQHVERFRQQTGRLPATLQQAGAHEDGLSYTPTSAGYRVEADMGGIRVTYDSSEPLARFLGSSFKIISRRSR